ncbi:hypothetical protein [Streptomyces sp. NBC_01538]|uniref:hypothetical protein n=1 Tax=Streptomyces sp. NBC_01538 TaxID=2903897 RepID=UPI003866CE8F
MRSLQHIAVHPPRAYLFPSGIPYPAGFAQLVRTAVAERTLTAGGPETGATGEVVVGVNVEPHPLDIVISTFLAAFAVAEGSVAATETEPPGRVDPGRVRLHEAVPGVLVLQVHRLPPRPRDVAEDDSPVGVVGTGGLPLGDLAQPGEDLLEGAGGHHLVGDAVGFSGRRR